MPTSGPPGGPHPADQPQDPWEGGQPHYPHPRPNDPDADPWGIAAAWGTAPTADAPDTQALPTYPAPPRYGRQPQYGPQSGHEADFPQQPEYLQQPPFLPQYPAPGQPAAFGEPEVGEEPTQYMPPAGYGPQPERPGADTWGSPAAEQGPRKRHSSRLILTMVGVLAVLLAGTVATGFFLASKKETDNAASRTASTAGPTPTPVASQPEPTPSPTPSASDVNDAQAAAVGDCLANGGTNDAPQMRKVACAKGTYEVIKRFPGTIDKTKCNGVPGYTHNYFFDSSVDTDDFVLCLKQQK
jgi:hypothetical protein